MNLGEIVAKNVSMFPLNSVITQDEDGMLTIWSPGKENELPPGLLQYFSESEDAWFPAKELEHIMEIEIGRAILADDYYEAKVCFKEWSQARAAHL